ncbi:MAG: UvrD-helicase domain-containing protein [Bacteroidales bacterium]|nr:UvrD-helicase domain-containing protein [Bacteroidales bacterium]
MPITQDKRHPLNIYRASAGSGKTHLLTGFYLKLLFSPQLLPETHSGEMKFSEILAVTFTNKATGEMKSRIIDQLFLLSQNPEQSDYFADIAPCFTKTSLTDPSERQRVAVAIREKATLLLVQILNEYSSFNISTIDSFFQRIVRSFARELNIPGNYEVELDTERVLEAAVTNFLDKLSRKDNPHLFNWMVRFSEKRIEEGSGWDFRDSLISLAKKVLGSETYRQHSDAIRTFTSDKERLGQYARMLDKLVRDWRETAKALGQQGKTLLELNGLQPSDFKYGGSGTISYFDKLLDGSHERPGNRFIKAVENPDTMCGKQVPQHVKDALQSLMQQCINHISGDSYCNYMTARAIQSNFYELGIIANIDKEVTAYCNEQNIMLLSSTTEMLSRLIKKDDAPFIYEKTGTRIHSYMIDEFQDTSGMQWGNFKPLLSNSIAQGYQNLIVGDVKQSIYRWRGGDWNLLNAEINDYEPWAHHDDSTSLTTNWRSLPAIVEFNNDFFRDLATKLDQKIGSERIRAIFADVEQHIAPPKQGDDKPQGYVNISFLEPKDDEGNPIDSPHVEDYVAEASRRLPLVIIELQQKGYRPSDIVILCRRNKECSWVAEALLRYKNEHPDCPYGMDIISSEALIISARPSIQTLIHLMRHLQSPDSDIFRAIAWCSFFQLGDCPPEEAIERYFSSNETQRAFHPELAHRPLYEMTEELIALLPAKARQQDAPFFQAFRDLVLEFLQTKGSDLSGFLVWWEQTGSKRAITTPDEQDAILIMTVHKSKGLGKPTVILPYASWEFDLGSRSSDILWCEPRKDPFKVDLSSPSSADQPSSDCPSQQPSVHAPNQNILLPIPLRSDLEFTIFHDDYVEERERVVIDNLNTAYVAFTRAKEALIIMAPKPSKDEGSDLKNWLQRYCQQQTGQNGLIQGSLERPSAANVPAPAVNGGNPSPSSVPALAVNCGLPSAPHLPNLSILHDPAKPDITAKEKGNYIHTVMQEIRTANDASQVIHDLYARGIIDEQVIDQPQMQQTIARILQLPAVAPWFQPGLQVLNELTIMDNEGHQQRPDRIVITPQGTAIVIDYKTGSDHPGYRRQVKNYMRLLRQMGYPSVSGFLLFIKNESIVQVQ